MRRYFFAFAGGVALWVTACTRDLTAQEVAGVAPQARHLLQQHPRPGEIAPTLWPASIAALRPQAVYSRPEGLYIRMSGFFVGERGYFVPSSREAVYDERGDPAYRKVAEGVYAYRIAG